MTIRSALAQNNTKVGDLPGNRNHIPENLERARRIYVDTQLFPEMSLIAYPPEDLLLNPTFVKAAKRAWQEIIPGSRVLSAYRGHSSCRWRCSMRSKPTYRIDGAESGSVAGRTLEEGVLFLEK